MTTNPQEGYELKVGDIIRIDKGPWGIAKYKVHRVTPRFAFVRYNDVAEGKYPRIYHKYFHPVPRTKWDRNTYEVIPT